MFKHSVKHAELFGFGECQLTTWLGTKVQTNVPCPGQIFDICGHNKNGDDSGIAAWTSDGFAEDIQNVHSACPNAKYQCGGEG